MGDILRDFKSFTSRSLKTAIQEHPAESRREWMLWLMERAGKKNSNNNDYQFWQQDNHPIELWDNYMMDQKLEYLHMNPCYQDSSTDRKRIFTAVQEIIQGRRDYSIFNLYYSTSGRLR